jgi:hypothetical protein
MAKEAEFPEKEEMMETVFKDVHPSASLSAVMEAPADAPVPKLPCIVRAVSEVTSENALVARALAPPKLFVMDADVTSAPAAKLSREAPVPVSEPSITHEVTPVAPESAWRREALVPVNEERMATEPIAASWAAKVADAPVPVKDPSISKEPRVEDANALVALIPASKKEFFIFTLAKEAPFRMEGAEGEVLTAAWAPTRVSVRALPSAPDPASAKEAHLRVNSLPRRCAPTSPSFASIPSRIVPGATGG